MTLAEHRSSGGSLLARVQYKYDVFGNRIERIAFDGTNTTTEHYGVDGWDTAKPQAVGTENFDTWIDLDGSNHL